MSRVKLTWTLLDPSHIALVFDGNTWDYFEAAAASRGGDPRDVIAEAVFQILEPCLERAADA